MRWQLEDFDFDSIDRAPIARCFGAVESFHRKDEFSANLRQLQSFAERAWALLTPVFRYRSSRANMCDTAQTEFAEALILINMRREHPLKRDGSGFSRAEFQLVGA